ncbi:MAG TPA: DNA primase [Ktedonobacterales bacterium]|nr:DNA primase [Ktedonobacterales bacterium]
MPSEATSVIERVKRSLDIIEQIGATVPLRKVGKAWRGLCPFHGERTPSFYVYPEGRWHCFGCGENGDLITFVEKTQGLDFMEALALLAERAGVSLERSHSDESYESAEGAGRKRLRALNEAAAIWFYHQLLQASAAQYARSYLNSRGVSNDSISLWRLGYAPDGDGLSVYLQSQGYTPKELIEAGLSREREPSRGGGLYDYFRNRLIFPIRNLAGQTIAFGGRELGGGHPKYLNTPQTVLFDKSATLYGIDLARDAIKRADRVIIVEGYMDVIVPSQHGTRNLVAVIGSALTEKHVHIIKRLTRRVTLALDPDAAGESATVRGITVAQRAFDRTVAPVPLAAPGAPTNRRGEPKGLVRFEEQVDAEITVARLPAHEDPDEFVRRDPEGWRAAIERAQPLIDFLLDVETAGLPLDTPQGKLEARRRLLPVIAEVRDRTLADEYVGRLAQKLRLDKIELRRDLLNARRQLDREARASHQRARDDEASRKVAASADSASHDGTDSESVRSEGVQPLGTKYRQAGSDLPPQGYSSSSAIGEHETNPLAPEQTPEQTLEAYCLGLPLVYPHIWEDISAILDEGDFTLSELRALYHALAQEASAQSFVSAETFIARQAPALGEAAAQARDRITAQALDEGRVVKVARDAAYRLKRMRLNHEMAELDALQREAEQARDDTALRALLDRKRHLLSQRRAIDAATALYG